MHASPNPTLSAPGSADPAPFLSWLLGRAGLDASLFQPKVLERRVKACFRWLGARSEVEAKETLKAHPELLRGLLDVALIGVSSFFRDDAVFREVGREIAGMVRTGRPGLRTLSAGSAEGQELYSVAMLLEEAGILGGSELLGVDFRPSAVVQAREGRYREPQLEGLDPERRGRHFRRVGAEFVIRSAFRERARWLVGNVLTHREKRPFDLVLCRNVAIYLTREGAIDLWSGLAGQVCPGGLLITGKAEKLPSLVGIESVAPCIYRKVS